MIKIFLRFLDKFEDGVRRSLSKKPIIYALLGSIGVILLWRGIWMTADLFVFMNGPVSILVGLFILLSIGLFVSFFVGDQIIISGIKEEKRIDEKTKEEIEKEWISIKEIKRSLEEIRKRLEKIEISIIEKE